MDTDNASSNSVMAEFPESLNSHPISKNDRLKAKPNLSPSGQLSNEIVTEQDSTRSYTKHCNLDVQPLSLHERLHLARIHYLTISNGIRLVIVLFCFGWFIYNTYTIWKEYCEHDTIVYLNYQSPNTSKPPAITFCTHCVLCSFNNSLTEVSVETVMKSNSIDQLVYKPVTHFYSVPGDDVLIDCKLNPSTIDKNYQVINCSTLMTTIVSMQEGHKCFTYFSDIYGDTRKAVQDKPQLTLHYDQLPQIMFRVEGYFLLGQESGHDKVVNIFGKPDRSYTGIYFSLHDPTILPDMYDLNFHQIPMNTITQISFTKTYQKLQPPPYKTNCYDYKPQTNDDDSDQVGEMRNDNLVNYQSRGECFMFCMWRDLNLDRCANFYSIYTEQMLAKDNIVRAAKLLKTLAEKDNVQWGVGGDKVNVDNVLEAIKFCARSNDSFYRYVRSKERCLNLCPEACEIETFVDQDIVKGDLKDTGHASSVVTILWATQPVTQIVHRPKFESTEFLGSLGGHAHIWLGLSVIHIVWFVLTLVQLGDIMPQTSGCDVLHWWKFWCVRQNR